MTLLNHYLERDSWASAATDVMPASRPGADVQGPGGDTTWYGGGSVTMPSVASASGVRRSVLIPWRVARG